MISPDHPTTTRCGGSGEQWRIVNPDWPQGDEPYRENTGDPCPGCPDCRPCERCGGKGYTWLDSAARREACPRCKGTGTEPTPVPGGEERADELENHANESTGTGPHGGSAPHDNARDRREEADSGDPFDPYRCQRCGKFYPYLDLMGDPVCECGSSSFWPAPDGPESELPRPLPDPTPAPEGERPNHGWGRFNGVTAEYVEGEKPEGIGWFPVSWVYRKVAEKLDQRTRELAQLHALLDTAEQEAASLRAKLGAVDDFIAQLAFVDDAGQPVLKSHEQMHKHHADEPYIGCLFCRDEFVLRSRAEAAEATVERLTTAIEEHRAEKRECQEGATMPICPRCKEADQTLYAALTQPQEPSE